MRLKEWAIMLTAVGGLSLPGVVVAQTVQERVDALEKKVEEQSQGLGAMLGIDFHAMLSTQYTYSFNRPDSGIIEYRVFDTDDNSISLDQANLYFGRNKEDESLGFTTNLDFGRPPRRLASSPVGIVTATAPSKTTLSSCVSSTRPTSCRSTCPKGSA